MTGADPYRTLAAGLPNGAIALFDSALRHRLFDGAEARAMGIEPGMGSGSCPGAIFPAEVAGEIERRYRDTIAGQPQSFDIRLGESEYRVVTAPLALDGEPHGIALFQNVTCDRRQQEQVWRKANFDDVTGLPNRRLTTDRLATALARARRYDKLGALLFVDLDDFKGVNDVHGHEAGDAVLRTVAERLTAAVRRSDTVGRFAGDEFLVVVSEIAGEEDADVVAEKVLEAIAEPIDIADEPVSVSASIGVALFPDAEAEAEQMIVRADHAMYAAKASGRNAARRAPKGWTARRIDGPEPQK